jgi:uncharacterized protein (UPF0332 family)
MEEYFDYLRKAQESLKIAEISYEEKCYNSCANRSYYAMLQAALAALRKEGIKPPGRRVDYAWLQATFNERLIKRKKVYPADFRSALMDTMAIRHIADYEPRMVSPRLASQALRMAKKFVGVVTDTICGGERL